MKSTQFMPKHSFKLNDFLVKREITISKNLLLNHTCKNCIFKCREGCEYNKYKGIIIMNELDVINDDIEKRREEQEEFKKTIVKNIAKTYRYYNKTEGNHLFYKNVKIDNYKLKHNGEYFKLYVDKKYILGWKNRYIELYFDNSSLLEIQDFNDKFVEFVKERLLDLKEKEENMAIEMIALKSLV